MALRNYSSTAARTTLSAGVTAVTTTLTVAATTGFPAAPFVLAVNAGATAQELVLVTNVAGTTLTVTRGYDSTVASAHDAGAVVEHSHAGIEFREANTHVNASSGVHGLAGGLVGTSDAQTLTGKTLALGSNTVTGTRAQFNAALTDDDFATLAGAETLTNKTLSNPAFTALPAGALVTNGVNCDAANTRSFLRGPVVILDIDAIATGAGVAVNETLFTLAAGHRPVALAHGDVINTSTAAPLRIHVLTDGTVTLQGTLAAGHTIRGSIALPL